MTKIALVLGGGVSLGSYIGGAISELLHAIQTNSLRSDGGPVRVHVITGTSAGAINAALAARSLAVNAELLPWIEKAWVDVASAEHLLNPNRADRRAWPRRTADSPHRESDARRGTASARPLRRRAGRGVAAHPPVRGFLFR